MQILLTGGTGFIGSELIKLFSTEQVILLTRDIKAAKKKLYHADLGNITYINSLDNYSDLNEVDAVINLAGEPIAAKRWTTKQKKNICDSRWNITKKLVELIHASSNPPALFISGSAVGYYGDQKERLIDESLAVDDDGFTHHVCATWESIAKQAQSDTTRVCIIRTGLVLGMEGGALPLMLPPFKYGVGSRLGSGKQYMPWIHILDMIKGIQFLLNTPHASGEFNFSAPHPVTNKEFSKTLASAIHRPMFLITPKWLFNIVLGEASCLLFDSVQCKPKRLTALGFNFTYPRLQPALRDLLKDK